MSTRRFIELNHVIRDGMITYPGLPAPAITPHLTREQSHAVYAAGTEFAIDTIAMIGNTGTYVDSPHHRFAGGTDLSGLPLESLADLTALVLRAGGSAGVDAAALSELGEVEGCAVLINSGDDARFGTPAYTQDSAFLTRDGAQWLVDHRAALVGIDSVNIDDATDGTRPAHTLLLQAGIPVVEHLTVLDQLPDRGARFFAVPPRVADFGTFPVRAFAILE